MKSPVHTIFFDVDGTLLNHWKRMYAVYKICCQQYGYTPLPFEKFRRNKRNGLPDATTKHRVWKQRRIEAASLLAKDTVVPGMKRVLRHVYKTHRVVAVSARQSKEKLVNQLEHLGILAYFDEIIAVGLDDPVCAKAQAMGEGIAIGDTEIEIAAAARAGIRCIAVGWGIRNPAFLRRAGLTRVVQTPEALERALEADT
ncbi:MAG: HAD hydrolase-like protein [Candidatus Gottesmanbacteria bacterium]|nr:HAD hydrolase-like protein [Candidatus Gottesmanbacteria bacterium]